MRVEVGVGARCSDPRRGGHHGVTARARGQHHTRRMQRAEAASSVVRPALIHCPRADGQHFACPRAGKFVELRPRAIDTFPGNIWIEGEHAAPRPLPERVRRGLATTTPPHRCETTLSRTGSAHRGRPRPSTSSACRSARH